MSIYVVIKQERAKVTVCNYHVYLFQVLIILILCQLSYSYLTKVVTCVQSIHWLLSNDMFHIFHCISLFPYHSNKTTSSPSSPAPPPAACSGSSPTSPPACPPPLGISV